MRAFPHALESSTPIARTSLELLRSACAARCPIAGAVDGHENATVGAFCERDALRPGPPETTGLLGIMTQHDQVDVQPLGVGGYLIDGIAACHVALGGDAARLEPLDRLA